MSMLEQDKSHHFSSPSIKGFQGDPLDEDDCLKALRAGVEVCGGGGRRRRGVTAAIKRPGAAERRSRVARSHSGGRSGGGDGSSGTAVTGMGTALAVRLGLGLLLLALLLPTQIYCNPNGTSPTPSNNSSAASTLSAVVNSLNSTTPHGHGNCLHSATSLLFILSVSLLYFCC
ncbi:signal transducer CD24 [Cygnus olor]|uniref:signal transducer CD24 n=1 Tax=Cygnus olor TaxID=8869 RepID=UPI001ADEB685|nr:signal transducer CD24 [Cygnus olor]